jgi:hypothetical protein
MHNGAIFHPMVQVNGKAICAVYTTGKEKGCLYMYIGRTLPFAWFSYHIMGPVRIGHENRVAHFQSNNSSCPLGLDGVQ